MIRTPLQRRTPIQRSAKSFASPSSVSSLTREKGLPRESRKRRAERRQYDALRKAFLDEAWCKCGRLAEVVQHRQGRGSHYLDVSTWSARCVGCERAEHDQPLASYASGDLLRRNSA